MLLSHTSRFSDDSLLSPIPQCLVLCMSQDPSHIPHIPPSYLLVKPFAHIYLGYTPFSIQWKEPNPPLCSVAMSTITSSNNGQFLLRALKPTCPALCLEPRQPLPPFQVDSGKHLLTEQLLPALSCSHLPCHSGLQEMKILLLLQERLPCSVSLDFPSHRHLRCCTVY